MPKILVLFLLIFPGLIFADLPPVYIDQLKVPPGFEIKIFARIPFVRQLTMGDDGMIYAGSSHHQGNNSVYAIKPSADFSSAEKIYTLATGLDSPIGVAFYHHDLYIGERYRISKIPNITGNWSHPAPVQSVLENIPPQKNGHNWKYLKFGPDQRLYFEVGDPVDTSQSDDPRLHSIMSIQPDGSDLQIYAHGIRNTVGFDWQPNTNVFWFTDNNQDHLGDTFPPDELNRAPTKGMDFGFPCYVGHNIRIPQYENCPPVATVTPPIVELDAHAAALGMMFYTGKQFPAGYKNNIFLAEHGSSIRADKVGYNILRVVVSKDQVSSVEPLVSGWLQGSTFWGRPVDIAQLPDGSAIISDDFSGTIYRLSIIKSQPRHRP